MNRDTRELRGRLDQAEESAKGRAPWRDRLYGRLKVSVVAMDRIIIAVVVLLVIVLMVGILTGNS